MRENLAIAVVLLLSLLAAVVPPAENPSTSIIASSAGEWSSHDLADILLVGHLPPEHPREAATSHKIAWSRDDFARTLRLDGMDRPFASVPCANVGLAPPQA